MGEVFPIRGATGFRVCGATRGGLIASADRKTEQRAVSAAIVAGVSILAFGMIGGIGFASRDASAAQYQYGKVTICHVPGKSGNRVTIEVDEHAVPAHRAHGDTLGPCF